MPSDDEDLLARLGEALALAPREPALERVSALRAAAAQLGGTAQVGGPARFSLDGAVGGTAGRRSRRLPRMSVVVLGAAASFVIAVAATVGTLVAERSGDGDAPAGGIVEFEATLRAPSGPATAAVVGVRTGIGRIVEIRTDTLPILPKGEFYEVWFVGPGDSLQSPNRISAGTFHPDDDGRSDVDLTAAVDPAKYPVLSVTAEPGDGDPRPAGLEVLSAPIQVTA